MKLLIAIPALNEEDSIQSIIERSLAARDTIIAFSPVDEVEITVVSDGSTDRTVELAQSYTDQIKLIVFEKNRGYGAAIKEAWRQSDANLLGFLDADGTCDPLFFTQLCNTLEAEQADMVIGCRLNVNSKMPLIRWVGNLMFALMLSFFSSTRVRDTASGMRVIRRSSLPKLMPLPNGLHFTPAMSARAILSADLKIAEIDMPYHERDGESKLRIGKDGIRFLKAILKAAFLYRPSRPLGFLAFLCIAFACALMAMPTLYYMQNQQVLEWMIYRFVLSNLLATSGFLLLSAGYLTKKIVNITLSSHHSSRSSQDISVAFFSSSFFWFIPLALMLAGGTLVMPSLMELVTVGATYEHWSRFISMSFLFQMALILLATRAVDFILDLIAIQIAYFKTHEQLESRVTPRADRDAPRLPELPDAVMPQS